MNEEPQGTLVVDLSRALSGPHATMMLGDGAALFYRRRRGRGYGPDRAWSVLWP
jgi:hypothetical protein